jgi:hypothetical protein
MTAPCDGVFYVDDSQLGPNDLSRLLGEIYIYILSYNDIVPRRKYIFCINLKHFPSLSLYF